MSSCTATGVVDRHEQLPRPLGDAQLPRRMAEQAVRRSAAELVHAGHSRVLVAGALQVAPQTLGAWMDLHEEPPPRGRPPAAVDPMVGINVAELLDSRGRSIGVPALKGLFPQVPRSALQNFRDQWDDDQQIDPCRLVWATPGSVWSADFTQPPAPIDGQFGHILVVRDLASQRNLPAAPCQRQSADIVCFHLRQLFDGHEPPFVLKTDNGSPFIAGATRDLCARHGVLNLLSPALTPQYNATSKPPAGNSRPAPPSSHGSTHATPGPATSSKPRASPPTRSTGRGGLGPPRPTSAGSGASPRAPGSAPHWPRSWRPRQPQSIQRERQMKGLATELTAACASTVARTAIRQALVELGLLFIRRPANMSTEINADLSRN